MNRSAMAGKLGGGRLQEMRSMRILTIASHLEFKAAYLDLLLGEKKEKKKHGL